MLTKLDEFRLSLRVKLYRDREVYKLLRVNSDRREVKEFQTAKLEKTPGIVR